MTTEQQFLSDHNKALKADLAAAEQTIALLRKQLAEAATEQEKLAYKCDFLTGEVARVTASREQYERVAIRVAGKMDSALDALTAMADSMRNEIRDAAFTKVPGAPKPIAEDAQLIADAEEMARKIAPETPVPPAPRFANGANAQH